MRFASGAERRAVTAASGLAAYVVALTGWRRAGLAIAAGALSVLALAPFFLWPVLFVTMPVLVWLVDGARGAAVRDCLPDVYGATRRAFSAGWLFGLGYFAAGLFWIGEAFLVEAEIFAWLMPFAVTILPAGLALFWGLATAAAQRFWHQGLSRVLTLAVSLGAIEWIRGHIFTGFPWNALGYMLTSTDALMQSAAVFGVYALSLWAVLIFAAPLVLLADAGAEPAADNGAARAKCRPAVAALAIAGLPLVLAWSWGAIRLASDDAPDVAGVQFRIVQPSIPQRDKWLGEKQGDIFRAHLGLSRQKATGEVDDLSGITHVVWPEAAMPFRPLDHPEALETIKGLLGTSVYLFAGALRVAAPPPAADGVAVPSGRPKAFNSLMVFGPGGGLVALYDKIHLVPFGEYLPWQSTLEWIGLQQLTRQRGGFSTGPQPRQPLRVAGLPPVIILICYEAIFPGEAVQTAERPGLIINVTNDGWFGNTTGPRQHFHQSRVRAVEEGLPLIRSANNGISAMVDAKGRVRSKLGMNERGVIDTTLPAALPATLYVRFGSLILICHLAFFAACAIRLRRN